MSSKHLLQVINLGKRSFADALRTQEVIRQRVIAQAASAQPVQSQTEQHDYYQGEPSDFLLLVEHWPAFTAGLRDKAFTDKDMDRLKSLGADVHRTNRGGLATFHGPGQLVAYPIINLKAHGFGLREYIARLESTLVNTCKDLGVTAKTTDETGVWVDDRKIASIGVNAKRYVTLHGIALNCTTDLSWFDHITPCGLEGVEMTSLSKEKGTDMHVSEAEWQFLKNFSANFDSHLSSVSDYVPAAIFCQDSKNPINARIF